jgi:general secretion pathway protein G
MEKHTTTNGEERSDMITSNMMRKDKNRNSQRGFTLIELMVVVTIVGILAAVAIVNVKHAQKKAQEAALKDDLHSLRRAIDDYYADHQKYPATLQDLVPHYVRRMPVDPITKTNDWEEVMDNPSDPSAPPPTSSGTGTDMSGPGVVDVKSKAPGNSLENVPYSEL